MKFENLLDYSADAVFVFNKSFITTVWNKKLVEKFNCPSNLAIGLPINKSPLFIKNDSFKSLCDKALKGENQTSYHNTFKSIKNDKVFYYTLIIEPILDNSGNVEGGFGTIKDIISVDKESSIYSFNDLINNDDTLPKILFSKEGKPLHFNEPCRDLWGITPRSEEYIRNNYNLFNDEQLANIDLMGQINRVGRFNQPDIPIVEYESKKTSSIKNLKNIRKRFSGFVKTNLDINGQFDSLEITLVDLSDKDAGGFENPWFAQKFQKLTNNLPGVIYEFVSVPNEEGVFNYISQSCEKVFGYTDKVIKTNPKLMRQLIHPDDIVSYLQTTKKADDNFTNWEWEGRFIVKGKTKWIKCHSRPEKTVNGNTIRYGIFTDVTTERKAQQKEKITSNRLELAIQGANLGLWDWVVSKNDFTVNDRFVSILGYSKSVISKNMEFWMNFVHPNEQALIHKKTINHLKGITEFLDLEIRMKKESGSWIWVGIKAQVTERGEDGRAIRLTGTIQDVDSRKRYEKILAESEARYRGLVEYSPVAIVVYREKKVVFANDQTFKLLGVNSEVEDLIGKDLLDYVDPEKRSRAEDRIAQVFNNKIPSQIVEETLIRKDGKKIIVEMVGIPFEDEGQPAIQIIASDVTDKISTERILKKSEKLLTQLFESSPIGIVLLDSSKRVVQINNGFQNIFGYTNDECFGKKLNQLIIPRGYRGQAINLNTLITGGSVVKEVESFRKDKNGNLVPVMIYGVPVSLNGKVIAIYGIYVDISGSKKVEEELKIRNEELDNFVYKVSHDLRSPLSSTLGLVHLANLEPNDDNLRQYIGLIGERITQLDRFISDVLSHSKNLKVEVSNSKIDFKEIIAEKFKELEYLPNAQVVKMNITIKGNSFYGDKWRISEVLRNLISNAIKYLNPTIDNPYINVTINTTQNEAKIIFEDNGIGISKEMLPRIFEMFYRATESSEGSGIGLYIVKNAIAKMGGEIKISSELNKGTSFEIVIPNSI